jgi:hypothetical protein
MHDSILGGLPWKFTVRPGCRQLQRRRVRAGPLFVAIGNNMPFSYLKITGT